MDQGKLYQATRSAQTERKAHFHLPGLFEFYELYKVFLPLFYNHREYFYDWCDIGSVYGAPADCLWGGGRVGFGNNDAGEVLALMREYGISSRLTFSNSLLRKEHLADRKCNELCALFEDREKTENGIIIYSDLLLNYIRKHYPGFYFVSSTTKVLTDREQFSAELNREEFRYVVPDFRLNRKFELWHALSGAKKDKVEFLCNECCRFGCSDRKACYENVSRKVLGEDCPDHKCLSPDAGDGYVFSKAMQNPGFIGTEDITGVYLPMGFSNFKIEGRSLGSALILEFLLYYMTRPEYQLQVREKIYLNNTLDLF
jgi:collagenase-like PrtC family protease